MLHRWRASPVSRPSGCNRRAPITGFRIVESHDAGSADVPVSIDTTTCDDCLAEVDDPSDRRYGYAFTNCTNCGPRYTIVLERSLRPPGHHDGRTSRCARSASPNTRIRPTGDSMPSPMPARCAARS